MFITLYVIRSNIFCYVICKFRYKKCICISQDGLVYDESNIDSLLLSRHIARKIRNSGGKLKGPHKRTVEQDDLFRNRITELLKNMQKEGQI